MQKWVTNVDIYSNIVLRRTIFRFYVEGEFLSVCKPLNWGTNKCGGSVSVYIDFMLRENFSVCKPLNWGTNKCGGSVSVYIDFILRENFSLFINP
jgi:hypothetical protein